MLIFGVILAGGTGQRLGGADKALLRLGGQPLAARAVDRFAPQVDRLALSANGDPARLAFLGLPVLPDPGPSQGPLSGILAALDWAAPLGATALVSTAVDVPFLPGDLVPRLCLAAEASARGAAFVQTADQPHPTCALWPLTARDALRAFLASGEKPRIRAFAATLDARPAAFAAEEFANLNTPQDIAAAEARLAAG